MSRHITIRVAVLAGLACITDICARAGHGQGVTPSPPTSSPVAGHNNAERITKKDDRPFVLEALVDFVDDAILSPVPITRQHIDGMMQRLQELGVRRVSWAYYGDGHGGMLFPAEYQVKEHPGGWKNCAAAYRELENPLKVAVEAGHRRGLKVYAYFKPYETGPAMMFPDGSPQASSMGLLPHQGGKLAWLSPFVKAHPELRIKRRVDDLPPDEKTAVVDTIRLVKKDDAPTRITKKHLQIWASKSNWQYQPKRVEFQLAETVEKAPREVRDNHGRVVTKVGQPVRVLTLKGLALTDKYILITTDFTDGDADFVNSGLALMTAFDHQGRAIHGVFATRHSVWAADLHDFREKGLDFDTGFGADKVKLDESNADGKHGLIAFTRGRNDYLAGALCETEPQVQEFWLRCLEEMIAAGVDGVDFREENHSTHTDYPEDYGFNDVVLQQCGKLTGQALLDQVAVVRGNAYTEFLRKCRARLSAAGVKMRYNLQVDWLRSDRPRERALAYPANVDWKWQQWIHDGLMDEAILRFFHLKPDSVLADATTRQVIEGCQEKKLPVIYNCYLSSNHGHLSERLQGVRQDGRFSGFILYETADIIRFGPEGACTISNSEVVEATKGFR
jgi:hypothetical protein